MIQLSITGTQLRIGRLALRLSVEDLAALSNVSTSTIKRIEADDGVPSSTAANIVALKTVLEAAGIEFVGAPDDRPGVRLGLPKS